MSKRISPIDAWVGKSSNGNYAIGQKGTALYDYAEVAGENYSIIGSTTKEPDESWQEVLENYKRMVESND